MATTKLTTTDLRAINTALGLALSGHSGDADDEESAGVPAGTFAAMEAAKEKVMTLIEARAKVGLRWRKVAGASTPEFMAPSAIVGVTYTIAKYAGQTRHDGQWRLTRSDEEETLDWARTLRRAKEIAQQLDDMRVAAASTATVAR